MHRGKFLLFCLFLLPFGMSKAWGADQLKFDRPAIKEIRKVQVPSIIKNAQLISPKIILQNIERQNLDKGIKLLINQQFGALVSRSSAVKPRVTVIGKVGNRIQAESLNVFLDKDTYLATLSKIDFDIEGDQVFLRRKIDHYTPPITAVLTPTAPSAAIMNIKKDILANLKISLPQGYGPKGLANTPCNDISTAVSWTGQIHNIFVEAFGIAEKKIGPQSTKAALMDILRKGTRLVAWNNIGHGNPDLIVEWNDELISYGDFNTTTPFVGIYNSVILLNSCDTCTGSYNLKNAIWKHKPRTYIAGSRGLPIGSSEEVDYHFWNYTLRQNQTIAWALNEAQKKKNLLGYFCLFGYNGKFAEVEAAKLTEDCIPFNYNQVQAKNVGGRWKVVQGNMWMLDFASRKDLAEKAVQIMKYYKLDRQCFVGRPNAPMQYYTTQGKAPQGSLAGEDCLSFNLNNVRVQNVGGRWKVVDGNQWIMDFDKEEAEANIAVKIMKYYGFNRVCYVGRPNAPMMYFKK